MNKAFDNPENHRYLMPTGFRVVRLFSPKF